MYKLIKDSLSGNIAMVKRLSDNAFIPLDTNNTDYQAYLKFLEEGNTPLPAEENQ
jgi:hypothetical protein